MQQNTQGSRGSTVKFLQEYLNWKISAGLATDGIWGAKTQAAVQRAGLPSRISNLDIDRLAKEYNEGNKPWWDIFSSSSSPNERASTQQNLSRSPMGRPPAVNERRLRGVHALS